EVTVVGHGQAILAARLQQHADEREQEVQVLRGRLEAERIDREVAMREANVPAAAAKQGGELLVTAAQIKDGGDGIVFLRMRDDEVHEERLPRARRARHQRVANIV